MDLGGSGSPTSLPWTEERVRSLFEYMSGSSSLGSVLEPPVVFPDS